MDDFLEIFTPNPPAIDYTGNTITCKIAKVQYNNPENGFSVLYVVPEGAFLTECMTVKMIDPTPGTTIKAKGSWVMTKYGMQFQATEWEEMLPTTPEGIEAYLSSGLIKGIGPIYAKKIVETFKEETFNVLDDNPDRLLEVEGIGDKRLEEIKESWKKNRVVRNLIMFLKRYEISTRLIIKIYNRYGEDSISILKDNPYRLADEVEGIGFKTADSIAINLGISMDSPKRVQCGIKYVLREMCDQEGDTYEPYDTIVYKTGELLEVDDDIVEDNIEELIKIGWLVDCNGKIYLKYLYNAEVYVAEKLKKILNYKPQIDVQNGTTLTIEEIETRTGVHYEGNQITAIETALSNNVMVLTGGPGTGKTTVTKGIIELLTSMGKTILLAAPTGKAAKRLSELTGRNAMTIHRLLGYNPATGCAHSEINPFIEDVLIVDEASMINLMLMDLLIHAVPERMKLIIIGDIDQLPCIGSGNVLGDIINSDVIPVVMLDKIFRQAQNSNIIVNAHRIKNGKDIIVDNTKDSDFFMMKMYDDVNKNVVKLVADRLPKAYGVTPKDIQVLTPMKKCEVGVDNLNEMLQAEINPTGNELKRGDTIYRVGDKVIQTVNNYDKDVFNGDSGVIDSVDVENKIVYIRFDDRIVQYAYADLEEVSLAYALTIHKSQGSEYPVIVIPITYANKRMMQRNLIYTAVTRAKKICVVVGDKRMVDTAIGNSKCYKRKTLLKERLQNVENF